MTPEFASYLSLFIGIFAIPFALIVGKYFSSRTKLYIAAEHEKLFDSSESRVTEDLKIEFCGEAIKNLHRWKVGIWNGGNHTFDSSSFIDGDPLAISFQGHKVIDVQQRRESSNVVSPYFLISDDFVEPYFDICDRTDGFVFVVFTEKIDSDDDARGWSKILGVSGSLRGLPEGLSKTVSPTNIDKKNAFGIGTAAFVFFVAGLSLGANEVIHLYNHWFGEGDLLLSFYEGWERAFRIGGAIFFAIIGLSMVALSVALVSFLTFSYFRIPRVIGRGFAEDGISALDSARSNIEES
jgi:hypothetical protein